MPNWVYSGVSITGDAAQVQAVKKQLAQPFERIGGSYIEGKYVQEVVTIEPTFSFWNIVRPEGEDRVKYDESLGAGGAMPYWYDWNIEHWGTKWDTDGEFEEHAKDHLHYRIETAWSPPVAALVALSAQYPDLHVEMEWEEEQGFGERLSSLRGRSPKPTRTTFPTRTRITLSAVRRTCASALGLRRISSSRIVLAPKVTAR